MQTSAREHAKAALSQLLARKDSRVFQDLSNFVAAMTAGAPGSEQEIAALAAGLAERIPWILRKNDGAEPTVTELNELLERLRNTQHLAGDTPEWSLMTWAEVLGGKLPPLSALQQRPAPGVEGATNPLRGSGLGLEFRLDTFGNVRILDIWVDWSKTFAQAEISFCKKNERVPSQFFSSNGIPGAMVSRTRQRGPKPVSIAAPAPAPASIAAPVAALVSTLAPEPTPVASVSAPASVPVSASVPAPAPRSLFASNEATTCGNKTRKDKTREHPTSAVVANGTTARQDCPTATNSVTGTRQMSKTVAFQGSYVDKLRLYEAAAAAGDARGQYDLGLLHLQGRGTPENKAEALRWFFSSAQQGYAEAQTQLGTMYLSGYGVELDLAQAVYWFSLAAQQGHQEAQQCLADLERM